MSCQRTYQELSAFAAGEIDTIGEDDARHHVLNCYQCRHRLEALALVDEVLQAASTVNPMTDVVETSILWSAIRRLPDRQQKAISMRVFDRRTYAEIADVLQVPPAVAAALVHRARGNLAQALEVLAHTSESMAIST
ncbi:MAG: sigma-70 family RNA polymerase sigma factor [Phycisphaerae bacterium]|nr:sigma-70 family RNA polymerase sigma factor [Phycisphaerae bacterium]